MGRIKIRRRLHSSGSLKTEGSTRGNLAGVTNITLFFCTVFHLLFYFFLLLCFRQLFKNSCLLSFSVFFFLFVSFCLSGRDLLNISHYDQGYVNSFFLLLLFPFSFFIILVCNSHLIELRCRTPFRLPDDGCCLASLKYKKRSYTTS